MCYYSCLGWKIPVNFHNITEVTIALAKKIITYAPLWPCFQKVLKKYLLREQSRVPLKCSFPRPKYGDLLSYLFTLYIFDYKWHSWSRFEIATRKCQVGSTKYIITVIVQDMFSSNGIFKVKFASQIL